jgi:FtsP/CotA-like multicopper oxidase with cupredoxin domain
VFSSYSHVRVFFVFAVAAASSSPSALLVLAQSSAVIAGVPTATTACVEKLAVTINGESPGPTIHATQGDTVVVTVHNKLLGMASGTSACRGPTAPTEFD